MRSTVVCVALGVVLGGFVCGSAVCAQESTKALPTLLIRGDVVSLDSADSDAVLLTLKDRYGFETPIYLNNETALTKEEQAVETEDLTPGATVEVEYNFDVNTAKRHAVSVKIAVAQSEGIEEVPEGIEEVPEGVEEVQDIRPEAVPVPEGVEAQAQIEATPDKIPAGIEKAVPIDE